jgi:hypothetical protein
VIGCDLGILPGLITDRGAGLCHHAGGFRWPRERFLSLLVPSTVSIDDVKIGKTK